MIEMFMNYDAFMADPNNQHTILSISFLIVSAYFIVAQCVKVQKEYKQSIANKEEK